MQPVKRAVEQTYSSYVSSALRTECSYEGTIAKIVMDPKKLRLLHAVIGLSTEVGELQDAVKKHLFYNEPLDLTNLKEEGGDLFWYLALLADFLGESNFTSMLRSNVAKLRERYPEKFTEEKAQNRDLLRERQILELNEAQQKAADAKGL